MELFIKVYETCPACKGTGWIEEEKDGEMECVLCYTCPVACGKVEKLVKIIDNDYRNFCVYLKTKIKNGEYEIEKDK